MPLIDLSRQTNLTVDAGDTLAVNGVIDIVASGLEIDSSAVLFSAAEANILAGATLSTEEINYVTGVTSSIQTQFDEITTGVTPFLGDVSIGENGSPFDLVVWGDLAVMGSGIIFDTERVQVEDPIMQLNYISGVPQAGVNGGMEIGRSATDNARLI